MTAKLILPFILLMLTACAGTKHAYQAADGIEEVAKVMNEHYFAIVKEANALADRGELTGSSLARAQSAVTATRPVINELSDAAQAYSAVRNATTEAELSDAINKAAIAISRLIDTLKQSSTASLIETPRYVLEAVA